jgi:hypothetical protein
MHPSPNLLELEPLDLDLSPEERDRIFDRVARLIVRWKLQVPAILNLELYKPLAFWGGHVLTVFTPLLAPAIGLRNMQTVCELLLKPGNIDRLIDRIEELAYANPPEGEDRLAAPKA